MSNEISHKLLPSDLVEEYNVKANNLSELYDRFNESKNRLIDGSSIMGTYGGNFWDRMTEPRPEPMQIQKVLRISAWKRVYNNWIKGLATAKDKDRIELMLENPPEFTINDIREQFGEYVKDPRGTVLRGLAEVFCGLDPFYKSHTKVGVGKKGLPKRIIISGFQEHSRYGRNKLEDVVNAIRSTRNEPRASFGDMADWVKSSRNSKELWLYDSIEIEDGVIAPVDDLKLKIYGNGNAHLYFGEKALFDINKGLSEYYGEVLPDVDIKTDKKQASTEVSKDLQYYPTPKAAVNHLFRDVYIADNYKVLEPSCGCGQLLDRARDNNRRAIRCGIEYDAGRANIARNKGHEVLIRNFLEVEADASFDLVVMNPPFYGKHYLKHVEHAIKFLKSGCKLHSILPASARYDHGLINKEWGRNVEVDFIQWSDLPVGSFSESGTNINTVVLTLRKS